MPLAVGHGVLCIAELQVPEDSPLVGKSVEEVKLGEQGVCVLELLRDESTTWAPRAQKIQAGDILLLRGEWGEISAVRDRRWAVTCTIPSHHNAALHPIEDLDT